MKYKDYAADIYFDDEAGIFYGRVLGIRDVIDFYGSSVKELKKNFHTSVDDYLAFCKKRGEQPDKPYSGKLVFRVEPDVHRDIAMAASRAKKSINQWLVEIARAQL